MREEDQGSVSERVGQARCRFSAAARAPELGQPVPEQRLGGLWAGGGWAGPRFPGSETLGERMASGSSSQF